MFYAYRFILLAFNVMIYFIKSNINTKTEDLFSNHIIPILYFTGFYLIDYTFGIESFAIYPKFSSVTIRVVYIIY